MTLFASPVLFSYFRSSCAHRVRIALHLKGVKFDYRPVHLLNNGGEQNSPDYLKLNPFGLVPLFIHGGHRISQSLVIIKYINLTWPELDLFLDDHNNWKFKILEVVEMINSGIQPLQNLRVLQELEYSFKASSDQKNKWAKGFIEKGLGAIEKIAQEVKTELPPGQESSFFFGLHVTAADLFLVPQMVSAMRFQVDLKTYPRLYEIFLNCQKIEAFRLSMPENQPDWVA
jgi:maleylacetoacetate isomerase